MKKKGEVQKFMDKAPYRIHKKVYKRLGKNHWKEVTPKFSHKFIAKKIKDHKTKKRTKRLQKTSFGRMRLSMENAWKEQKQKWKNERDLKKKNKKKNAIPKKITK